MAGDPLRILHEATLRLLERTGVFIGSSEAFDLLEDSGIRVDRSRGRAFPTPENIERALGSAPRSFAVYGRRIDKPLHFDGAQTYFLSGGASLRVLELDGRYTEATLDHLHQFNRLLDALPYVHMMINQVDPVELHGPKLYRLLAAEMLVDTPKSICFQAASRPDVEAMLAMGDVIRGSRHAQVDKPVFFVGLNSEPPLAISAGICDALLSCCLAGIPASLGNYNMMGITAPRTVAGAVVQLNALQLTAVVLAQACRPGVPIFYTAFSGSGNLKTLDPVCSDPLSVQQQRLTMKLGRSYGLPVYGFAGTDSRAPDAQAACEHAFQFQLAMDVGCSLLQGPFSMMDQMMMSSFAQAVIDHDIIAYLLASRVEPPIDEESLGLEVIDEVISDPGLRDLKYAAHPHTVRHLQEGLWARRAFNYESFAAWQKAGSPSVVDNAAEAARRILDEHVPEALPAAQAAALRAIAASYGSAQGDSRGREGR
jgi:trimethylamine--corrinoid protein Co-methyltransferase